MNFYPQLNGLRFCFIFMVLLQHWGPLSLYRDFHMGGLGVDLFFVLSGFLIGEILFIEKEKTTSKRTSLKNFYIKRSLRIFPLYYATLALYGVLFTTGGILLWNLTYTTNILECIDKMRVPKEFSHLWSLCVEEQFYLVFPFLALYVPLKRIKPLLLITICCTIAFRFIITIAKVPDAEVWSQRLMPASLDCLFAGVLLAYYKTYKQDSLKALFSKKILVYTVIILSMIAVYIIRSGQNQLLNNTLYRVNASLLGFAAIGFSVMVGFRGVVKTFLENSFIASLGKISYGIYMLHPFVEEQYYRLIDNNWVRNKLISFNTPVVSNRYIIDFISLFGITVIIAYTSFYFFESRFLKLKKYYS